jgi:hypothetical protein
MKQATSPADYLGLATQIVDGLQADLERFNEKVATMAKELKSALADRDAAARLLELQSAVVEQMRSSAEDEETPAPDPEQEEGESRCISDCDTCLEEYSSETCPKTQADEPPAEGVGPLAEVDASVALDHDPEMATQSEPITDPVDRTHQVRVYFPPGKMGYSEVGPLTRYGELIADHLPDEDPTGFCIVDGHDKPRNPRDTIQQREWGHDFHVRAIAW